MQVDIKGDSEFVVELLKTDEKELVEKMKSDLIFRSNFRKFESKINDNDWQCKKELIEAQNDPVIAHLIKLLTVLDREISYMCRMSMSAVPGLLRVLSARKSSMYEPMLDWVFKNKNRENYWLPLGEFRHGSISSIEEYRALKNKDLVGNE